MSEVLLLPVEWAAEQSGNMTTGKQPQHEQGRVLSTTAKRDKTIRPSKIFRNLI